MREIKFKLVDNNNIVLGPYSLQDIYKIGEALNWENCRWIEFTGLKDKNGKEIYEGDICRYWMDDIWKVGKIVWNRGGWSINVVIMGDRKSDVMFNFQSFIPCPPTGYVMQDEFEVIGNIYENPELLTHQRTTR